MSAHGAVQEFINLNEQLYGLATNGRVLRLLRDSSRLIKLSYLEFDFDRIFTDGLFADFAALFRLLHVTRLPIANEVADQSWIERYHQDSLEAGARIRKGLSSAVDQAIRKFADGFLSHPENDVLRNLVATGALSPDDYYKQLLRLIYRLLFLMVIEERDLVFPPKAAASWRETYRRYYSVQRLRLLSERLYLFEHRRYDLWLALSATFRLFEADGPGERLGVAPLAGDLFGHAAIGPLAECHLGNDVLLSCLRSLSLYEHPENRQLIRVNYAALNVEEFGSVYEGLLKYLPTFQQDAGKWALVLSAGTDDTQSHYTDDDLVQPLIKHSLDYLIAERLKAQNPEAALMDLRVADIACGSGHILLAAARRIATELAIVRTGEEQPSPSAYRKALRDVIGTCIYGVDLNPLAVELCKVALWLEAHNPGQPLNFLDHHIKCGNAIVGYARREDMERGVPDEAFATMPGDDKEVAARWRKKNKQDRADPQRAKQLQFGTTIQHQLDEIRAQWTTLSGLSERTPAEIEQKKSRFVAFAESQDAWLLNQIAAIPSAQFYIPKTLENERKLIADEHFRRYWTSAQTPQGEATAMAWATAHQRRFFHWFLEFPDVIACGGFDCILGNPPYLGGTDLSGTFGRPFCAYVKWEYEPAGLSDLVVYFVRRIFALLKPGAFSAFITTNSIKDGRIREDGLDQVLAQGGNINMAVRGIKWPGRANLVVSLVAVHKGEWRGKRVLDGKEVAAISAYFEDADDDLGPAQLLENASTVLEGSKTRGEGFFITRQEARILTSEDPRNADVVLPILSGKEITDVPDQSPQRCAIYFSDWDLRRADEYQQPLQLLQNRLGTQRADLADRRLSQRWWLFERPRIELYRRIGVLRRCFAASAHAKYLNFVALPTTDLFTHGAKVFVTDRWDLYVVVQSTLHEVWARKYSGAIETRLRYSPTLCFETFAFPADLWQTANLALAEVGERYHEHRKSLMLSLWLGLTDIYNLVHARDLSPAKVAKVSKKTEEEAEHGYQALLELRRLHRELDLAVRDAYGWQNLDLGHDFHEVDTLPENDRVRLTISPAARKEVLRRLLALNHERSQAQAAEVPSKKRRAALGAAVQKMDLSQLPDGAWHRTATAPAADLVAILAAILKDGKGPELASRVRLATLLIYEPRLLTPALTSDEARHWRRLVGNAETKPLALNVTAFVPQANHAWGAALRHLRGNGMLIEDLAANTWAPGPGIDAIDTTGWPEGRAKMVLTVLRRRGGEDVIQTLPAAAQRWVDERAA